MSSADHSIEPAAEWVAIDTIRPWPGNPRKNDGSVGRVADSIKRFGFAAPIIARREDGQIIAGHTRFKAAQKLKLDRVPVRWMDLDPADARLLALADNRLGEFAEWDQDELLKILGDLRQQDKDAALVAGWDDQQIDMLIAQAGNESLNFDPASEDEQGRLDQKAPIICPNCSHEFTP